MQIPPVPIPPRFGGERVVERVPDLVVELPRRAPHPHPPPRAVDVDELYVADPRVLGDAEGVEPLVSEKRVRQATNV